MEKIICNSCGFDSDGYSIFESKCPSCGEPNKLAPHHRIVNLTPHEINYVEQNDRCEYFIAETYPSEGVARCEVSSQNVGVYYDAYGYDCRSATPVLRRIAYGSVTGLPEPLPGVMFIVSRIVKNAVPERDDCVVPDDLIRDKDGQPIGCTGFAY